MTTHKKNTKIIVPRRTSFNDSNVNKLEGMHYRADTPLSRNELNEKPQKF
jgi:hypothetical protein